MPELALALLDVLEKFPRISWLGNHHRDGHGFLPAPQGKGGAVVLLLIFGCRRRRAVPVVVVGSDTKYEVKGITRTCRLISKNILQYARLYGDLHVVGSSVLNVYLAFNRSATMKAECVPYVANRQRPGNVESNDIAMLRQIVREKHRSPTQLSQSPSSSQAKVRSGLPDTLTSAFSNFGHLLHLNKRLHLCETGTSTRPVIP